MLLTTKLDSEYHCWSKFEYLAVSCHTWDIFPWQQQSYRSFDWYIFALYGWSILNGHYPLLKLAVEQRSSVKIDIFNLPLFNHVGSSSALPMSVAAGVGNIRVFELLWETLNSSEPIDNLLQVACAKGHVEIVQVLLNHGVDRKAALRQGNHQIIQYLLDTGAQIDHDIGTFETVYPDTNTTIAFSPDGKLLASSSSGIVRLWNVATKEVLCVLLGHYRAAKVEAIAFSPDGAMVATGSSDSMIGLWNAATGHNLEFLNGHTSFVSAVAFSPDKRLLASGSSDSTIKLWDVTSVAVDRLRETALAIKPQHTFGRHRGRVNAVEFSPDGKLLASGSSDRTIMIWDMVLMKAERMFLNTAIVLAVAFSPDGRLLISGSMYGMVRIWDLATGGFREAIMNHPRIPIVVSVAFSPGGKLVASGYADGTVRVWDMDVGEAKRMLDGHTEVVEAVAFSPGGKLASMSRGTVKLWLTC
jgi:WD40 repeat protein